MTKKNKSSNKWNETTWKGHRLAQHVSFNKLSFADKLKQIESLNEFSKTITNSPIKYSSNFQNEAQSSMSVAETSSIYKTGKSTNTIPLPGCRPIPLAAYLKGLGIFRLVAEQANPEAHCCWQNEHLTLNTRLSPEGLVAFFLNDYRPSAILAPWNGGSGFYPKDNDKALKALEASSAIRFQPYQLCIEKSRQAINQLGLKQKPEKESKHDLLQSLRNNLPEDAIEWLDAAFLLGDDGAKFPPLLGTGGNDGRLEFTNNFMQRLGEVFNLQDDVPSTSSEKWLRSALLDDAFPGFEKAPVGQFDPSSAGGANAGTGFDAASLVNPWDFILMIEGALLFAVASAKRLESVSQGQLAYPFCVRPAGVGYASGSLADEKASRAEMWMPLWEHPVGFAELRTVLNEGRAQISGRPARNGVDFARAVTSLGVDRGLASFQRFGFQVRNGLAYFATPLDRLPVQRNTSVRLLEEIDPWLDRFRSKAASDNPAPPAGVASALRCLEDSILRLCQAESPDRVQDVLIALGHCERTLVRSLRWTRESAYLQPLQGLSLKWLKAANAASPEFRLAAALASSTLLAKDRQLPFRHFLEPVASHGNKETHWFAWRDELPAETAWIEGKPTEALNAIFHRQLLIAQNADLQTFYLRARKPAFLADIADFIEGNLDLSLFTDLLWGLCLLDWRSTDDPPSIAHPQEKHTPDALYALLRRCFPGSKTLEPAVPINPAIHHHAARGNAIQASRLATQRLRASGLQPAIRELQANTQHTQRTAAALCFPIAPPNLQRLAHQVLHVQDFEDKPKKPAFSFEDED